MTIIYHQVGIRAPADKVYKALSTLEGLSSWWSTATGSCEIGGNITFHFDDLTAKMKVEASMEDKLVQWRCIVEEGEWKHTLITFGLIDDDEHNQTLVNFTHAEWEEITDLFAHCSTKWAMFLLSLKDYVETGKGRPYPHDIQISYYE